MARWDPLASSYRLRDSRESADLIISISGAATTGTFALGATGFTLSQILTLTGGLTISTGAFAFDGTTFTANGTGVAALESSAAAISVGGNAVAQPVNIATGAAARVITIGNAASASMALDAGVGAFSVLADTTVDIDAGTALGIESAGGAISIGADAVVQPVNIATGAAARIITIGNAASASLALESGVGAGTWNADTSIALNAGTTLDLDAVGAASLESSGAAINVGVDAIAQPVNLATGAAARVITLGNAASASLAVEGGVGGITAQCDTTMALDAGTALTIESAGGAISLGADAVVQPVNIATGAAARIITIGNAASASLALEAGVGALTANADTSIALDAGTTLDLDSAGIASLESSGAAINVGADAIAQPVNLATGAAARVITIGNAASASLALEAGVGPFTLLADTTVDIDAGTALGIESAGGAISVGADAIVQPVNIATGAAARIITIGNAASASLALEAGVGALTANADTSIALDAGTTLDLDAAGIASLESSGAAINVGNDAIAQPVNIATGAAARVITVGNAASASLALEGGVGPVTVLADTTIDIDAGTALGIESAGGAISLGADAVVQPVNIATGAAARIITIGNAASASLALEAGVGAFSANADTTIAIDAGTTLDLDSAGILSINSSGAAISIGEDAVAQPVNLATGAAARVITIGNAASASLALEAGVGAGSFTSDTTITLTAGTSVAVVAPLTTTNGITAGTVKTVGGRAYSSVADSTTLTELAAPTLTDTTYPMPANMALAGTTVTVDVVCRSIAFNGADTHIYQLQCNDTAGAEVLVASVAVTQAAGNPVGTNGRVHLRGTTSYRAAPGGAVEASSFYEAFITGAAAYSSGPAAGAVQTFNTAAINTFEVLVTHSANSAGNQSVVESMRVWID